MPRPPPRDLPNSVIFKTQGSNPSLMHCRIIYYLSHQGSPAVAIGQQNFGFHPILKMGNAKGNFKHTMWVSKRQRTQRLNCYHLLNHRESKEVPEKYLFVLLTMLKTLIDHNKLEKNLNEMGVPDHLICLLRNPYMGQEATVRIRQGTYVWF